jgi:hypothetical protein
MTVLSAGFRSTLERATVAARDAAEDSCRVALGVVGVDTDRVRDHLGEDERRLRVALRAEARQLGGFERLVEECAYELWHRMLFARFLAENDLLIHPQHGVPVTLDECKEVADARGDTDLWVVASEFASAMLPGIFRPDDPALQLMLAPEGQQKLEEILAGLPREVFTSEDGVGWVYQYWQTKKKKEVNASERKIGGADIAPVTQLFTENYMVRFLLENTLGAWWAARHPESPLLGEWEYLRFDDDGKPAAGSFPGWPERVAEVTVMDPCCGSGHFLVVAFEMLRRMRIEAESISAAEAGEAVLRENLFGLELDPRCTQIAAFALALQAWKTGGYRGLPIPNVACSGISAKGRLEDWKKLARGDERLELSLERLHALFSDAGDLGSLVDPLLETDGELLAAQFEEVAPVLEAALGRERTSDPSGAVFGNAAVGAARAGSLLARGYTLVTTNPPFLGRGKQDRRLRNYSERAHPLAKGDLATCFIERNMTLACAGGTVATVAPQNWIASAAYERLRRDLLQRVTWKALVKLGTRAFGSITGERVTATLFLATAAKPSDDSSFFGIDASSGKEPAVKRERVLRDPLVVLLQRDQLRHPEARLIFANRFGVRLLSDYASSILGLGTGDYSHYGRYFWEFEMIGPNWEFQRSAFNETSEWSGCQNVIAWDHDEGRVRGMSAQERIQIHNQDRSGSQAWGNRGVAVTLVSELKASLYAGEVYDKALAVLVAHDSTTLPALWAFAASQDFNRAVRSLDSNVVVANGTLLRVPFDVDRWTERAAKFFRSGLPKPHSTDASQWLFDGHPHRADAQLHVSVARLAGYRWPRQTGSEFPDCPAMGPDGLEIFADDDGIVCVPSVRSERAAAERLRTLLAAAFGEEWSPAREADLLVEVGYSGKSLEQWLREGFFEQHCQLFRHRPFVWHIWDGRRDGFSSLVNYHRLNRANLEKLTYTYLGDWIRQQREAAVAGAPGSDLRLAAAEELRKKLALILEGEPPFDIFVRWRPIEEQPIGWEPDLNDGVRLNIRPFVTAGVLRKNPKIKWGKDRGKDPESAPWYPVFKGDRINDHHLTLAEKRAAREAVERRAAAS